MPLSKSVVKFEGLNENHSCCSAWLKDKDRFCRRTVANSDEKRRRFLLQSISCGREYAGNDEEEIADLYFCKGWHRKGGHYAIPSTERLKVLQMCLQRVPGANEASDRRTAPPSRPRPSRYVVEHEDSPFSLAPVLMTGNQTASLPSDAPASLVTNIGSSFEGPEVPEAERPTFTIAQSALTSMENGVSTLSNLPAAISTSLSIRAESNPVERPLWEGDFQRQAQAEHLSPDHVDETPSIQQLSRSARIRRLERGGPPEVSRLTGQGTALPFTTPVTRTRQRDRIQEQEIDPQRTTDHSSNDQEPSSRFAPEIQRRSARLRGQQQDTSRRADHPTASRSQVALDSTPHQRSTRIQRQGQHTNVDAAAQVLATTRTPAPQNSPISRSNDRDYIQPAHTSLSASTRRPLEHRMTRDVNEGEDCGICKEALGAGSNVARCYNCANDFHKFCLAEWFTAGSKTCGFCRAPFTTAHVKLLIESLGDEGTKFRELHL